MDFRRFLRGPAFFVVVGLLLLLLATQIFSSGGFQRIDTADGLRLLEEGKVEQAKIVDREQRVDLTLADDFGDKGTKVQFFYVQPRGTEVVEAVNEADLAKPFNDEVPKDSWWATLFVTLLPILLLVGLFWFMLSQMQGGGCASSTSASPRPSWSARTPPRSPSPTSRAPTRRSTSSSRSRSSSPSRPSSRPWARRSPRACCSTARPVPARRCSPAPSPARRACRSTRSPARTSSRCSSASVPRGCATCSSRPRPTPRRSSSSTRSTPSAATAVPAWAVGTTSASRP